MTTERPRWPITTGSTLRRRGRPLDHVASGSTMAMGELPHRDARLGTEFSLGCFDVATIPQLPEIGGGSLLAQAFGDLPGVRVDGRRLRVDPRALDLGDLPPVDVSTPVFSGFEHALAQLAANESSAELLKWQFLGPISGGVALMSAGVDPIDALEISHIVIRRKLAALAYAIDTADPRIRQICILHEPHISSIARRSFPLAIDESVDLLSCAMATVQQTASVGVHTCANLDIGVLVETGPEILSLPVRPSVVRGAAHLDRYLRSGGWIAWGAVPSDGRVPASGRPAAQELLQLWAALVRQGCDPGLLCARSLVTPSCGLRRRSLSEVDRTRAALDQVAGLVRSDAVRSMVTFGR